MDGTLTADERRAVGAAHALRLVRTDQWPLVAAHLLAQGAEGDALSELAGLSRDASGWEVDQLLPDALAEAGISDLTVSEAGAVSAQALGQSVDAGVPVESCVVVRALAELSPGLDYPSGVIGEAYSLSEWLDCDCHEGSAERQAAFALEARFRSSSVLEADQDLLRALHFGRA
jgi:hypothetical protein